jgi:hypothetical protein
VCESEGEEVDGMGEEGVQGGEGGEVDGVVRVDGEGLRWEGAHSEVDGPFYYPRSHSRDGSFDDFVARCADHEGTPRVYGGKKGVAVFEAMLKVGKGFVEFFDEPVEFSSLGELDDRFKLV